MRHFRGVLAVLAATVGLAACGGGGGAATSSTKSGDSTPAATPTKLTLAYFPATIQTFYIDVAQKQGFFKENKLQVDPVAIASGPDLAAALDGGSSQISDEGLAIIGPLMQRGEQMVTLLGNIELNYGLAVKPSVPTPNASAPFPAPLKDLKGLKIGITARGSLTEDFANRLLKAAGLKPSDVTYIAAGTPPAIAAAFKAGRVDAAVTFPPVAQLLGTEGKDYKLIADVPQKKNVGQLFDGYLVDVYAAMKPWIEKNRAAATGFCRAMIKAADWAGDPANLDAVAKLLADWVNLPQAQSKQIWQQYKGTFSQRVTAATWQQQGKYALSQGSTDYYKSVDSECQSLLP